MAFLGRTTGPQNEYQQMVSSLKKAVTAEESPPKEKHVRKCIEYTWAEESCPSTWEAFRLNTPLDNEVSIFKALLVLHRLMQEGHRSMTHEPFNRDRLLIAYKQALEYDFSPNGYINLIKGYVTLLQKKIHFHRNNGAFDGLFEYDEAVARQVAASPEGNLVVSALMNLQDEIETFQKMILKSFAASESTELRTGALVPLIKEAYGINRFIIAILRAMYRNDPPLRINLEPLRQRYQSQHHKLRNFYSEASTLPYLLTLINVPTLSAEPSQVTNAALTVTTTVAEPPSSFTTTVPEPPPAPFQMGVQQQPSPLSQAPYIAEQVRLMKMYEARKNAAAPVQPSIAGPSNPPPPVPTNASQPSPSPSNPYTANPAQPSSLAPILGSNSERVKELEAELKKQCDETEQWKSRYEALAKLYTQLRGEHFDMLPKFKSMQLKVKRLEGEPPSLDQVDAKLAHS